jgi:hypothetical protein
MSEDVPKSGLSLFFFFFAQHKTKEVTRVSAIHDQSRCDGTSEASGQWGCTILGAANFTDL